MFYRMAGKDLTKMDAIMSMPLMEFFNYAAMLKTMEKEQMNWDSTTISPLWLLRCYEDQLQETSACALSESHP